MRGLWIDTEGLRLREDLPEPRPGPGESLVAVTATGVCATDLALARGYMGFQGVPGHEFVGRVLEGPHAGRRVVGEINAACGTCATCAAGSPRHCPERTVLGILGRPGAFAERLCLPHGNLHLVPDDVRDEQAVFAEPLAAAFEIAEQLELEPGTPALVLGDGRLGLLCAQVLALHGLEVTLVGRHPERAGLLTPGVRHAGGLEALGGRRFPLAVEATGRPEVLQQALGLVSPRGTLVLKTTAERPASLDLAPLVVDEIRLQGSRCGPFEPALEALASGAVRVDGLLAARYPLSAAPEAVAHAARPGTLKVLVDVAPARSRGAPLRTGPVRSG